MLSNPPPVLRKRHRLPKPTTLPAPVPPTAPTLVAAEFLRETGYQLRLTFDRAVNVSDFEYGQLRLYDGEFDQFWYKAYEPTFLDPMTVIWELSEQEQWAGPGVTMTASPTTGIIAVDNGVAWAGVIDLLLPFP